MLNNNSSIIPQKDDKLLLSFENIKKSIAEIDDLKELQDIRNLADGYETSWKKYYRTSGFGKAYQERTRKGNGRTCSVEGRTHRYLSALRHLHNYFERPFIPPHRSDGQRIKGHL